MSIRTFLLFLTLSFLTNMSAKGQTPIKSYPKEWQKVQDFVKKNLPKSALTEVKNIYTMAKREKQDAQIVKSLVFMIQLQQETREDEAILAIKEVEKEIGANNETVNALLNSLLGSLYQTYYANHRWDLFNRTTTVDFKQADLATWSAEDLHRKTNELYLVSLKNEKLLQSTALKPYDEIVMKGNVRHLRPTLFDLLAHRALEYFQNDEQNLHKAAYVFEIDQASAFDPAADFVTRKFVTKDSLSLQQKALLIYQRILAFHMNDAKHDALIDADIHRLQFVRSKSVHPDKNELYFNSINHIAHQYENQPAADQAWYLVAAYYEEQANTYRPNGDTTHRFDRIKAKEICEKLLKNFNSKSKADSTEGKGNCYNLLRQLKENDLSFAIEKVNIPNGSFRSLVKYRNFNKLFLRLVKADATLKKLLEEQYNERFWPGIVSSKAFKTWQQALPETNDMQQHSVEIKVEGLPVGEYLLVVGNQENFGDKNTILGARMFYVSAISYVNNSRDYFVLNRQTGDPLTNASVVVWERKYDYTTSKYVNGQYGTYKTDKNGYFAWKEKKETANAKKNQYQQAQYQFEINSGSDRLFINEYDYDYFYSNAADEEAALIHKAFLFTDRGIYRPGQTLFFKGILLSRTSAKDRKANLLTNFKTTLRLKDVNGEQIDSMVLTTNEYGSITGKFQLPSTVLTGDFTLETDYGTVNIKVEEYKRPKYYVDYEPIKGTYKVNDKIKINGMAKAYAGNNIDGATVKYRVVRQPRFIYPWLTWRWYMPPSEPMEIVHGETVTDKDGKFMVEFTAIPDNKIDRKFEPVFDYTVYADVTDINGESRSGEQRVSVSYNSLMIKANIPSSISIDSLRSLSINTQNMSGVFEPAKINVKIYRLKEEKRLIRERLWQRPDQFILSKEAYIQNFPYDEYDNETDYKTWEKGALVLDKSDSTKENGVWAIGNGPWTGGFYTIEISTVDKDGHPVKDIRYVEFFDSKSNQLSRPQWLWASGAGPIEPGEKASVVIGTSAENVFLVQDIDKDKQSGNPIAYSVSRLNQEKTTFEFPATEADRGGYGVGWIFVKQNRFYQYSQSIIVPWSNKDLSIEYASFRDKTLPGSEEKWKLKIKGYKNEKLAAEMIASMYDASLDQFYPFAWSTPGIYENYYSRSFWRSTQSFGQVQSQIRNMIESEYFYVMKDYDNLFSVMDEGYYGQGFMDAAAPPRPRMVANSNYLMEQKMEITAGIGGMKKKDSDGDGIVTFANAASDSVSYKLTFATGTTPQQEGPQGPEVKIRKNFNETAFFFPELRTDSSGAIEFSFTMPEALTRWKFQAIAHTKDLAFGYTSKEIVTQKELMVQPNPTRFLREGDKMEFSAKIVNLTDKELTGQAQLLLFDATTNESVDGWFHNSFPNQYFTVAAGQSEAVKFPVDIPYLFNKALTWRIVARAGNFSDGEEAALPVLSNRMLVTETMPLPMRGNGTKEFNFTKLLNSGSSETLQQHALTVEYTSNPAWFAIQALPYLMEYPYDCAEQTWNRYYANSLATLIANSSPRIKAVFERWKTSDTAALLSNLQKNPELKSVLLEETPWVLQAKTEAEQKKNIALLFDMVKMSEQLNTSFEKLRQLQSSNGGFVWFKGGPDDRYMTQYIVTSIGHLKKLNGIAKGQEAKLNSILSTAIPYLDRKIKEDYDNLVKYKTDLKKYAPGYITIQYLYMRSFFPDMKITTASQKAYDYFRGRLPLTWTTQNKYMQGMTALFLYRKGDLKTPAAILRSLKETSINNEELGMYWKDASRSWWWYEAPLERQALLIEAFQEITKDAKIVDDLRTWLLKNKQTNSWESTRSTAEACYALLLQGTQWLDSSPMVQVKLGTTTINSDDNKQEAGTGYFKKTIEGRDVKPEMGKISVSVTSPGTNTGASWGGVYWQYFEDLDKITSSATPLKLVNKLFVEKNGDRGPVLTPVNEGDALKVGDKVKVRIELRVDREMEYVHMKDMRAASMEPVNVLSGYSWQGGLGYYEATKDASTNFFFSSLRRGTYVFEYPLFVTHTGNFSNGVTTIQCMYAPEFTAHSEGIRINVE